MNPPRRANAISLFAALAIVIAAAGATARAADARSLFATSSGEQTWLVRQPPPTASTTSPTGWSVLRKRRPATDEYWSLITTLAERPAEVATFGERLVVLYEDGSWSLVGFSNGAPSQMSGPPLPPEHHAIAVAQFAETLSFLTRRNDEDEAGTLTRVDFDGTSFVEVAAVPYADRDASIDFAVDDRGAVVAIARGGSAELLRVAKPSASLATLPGVDDIALTAGATHVVSRSAGVTSMATIGPAGIGRPIDLPVPPGGRIAVTSDGERLLVYTADADVVIERAFATDGASLNPASPVTLRPPPTPPLLERALFIVAALTMLVVLFAGGRQTFAGKGRTLPKVLPTPAPLGRRLAAGLIDFLPLAACAGYLATRGRLTVFSGVLQFDSRRSEALLAAGVVLYLVLYLASELRWRQSLGKAIFALRVVALDGGNPRPRAIVIRNVMRLADLSPIILLFVLISPLRQRLGDFVAGTMVVDDAEAGAGDSAEDVQQNRRDRADP